MRFEADQMLSAPHICFR